ncbi:hypothetical protein FQA39_LY18781 [Lamprigera yunnana]|nr:hypothetical protein FQA39_LY18781 [Lamprigera yunnana]
MGTIIKFGKAMFKIPEENDDTQKYDAEELEKKSTLDEVKEMITASGLKNAFAEKKKPAAKGQQLPRRLYSCLKSSCQKKVTPFTSTEYLQRLLGYKKGDIYDAVGIQQKVVKTAWLRNDSISNPLYE